MGWVQGNKERGKREGRDREQEVFEYKIRYIARLIAWIMTVLEWMTSEGTRGGKSQNIYVDKFQKFLPISIRQIFDDMYKFLKEKEPVDLIISTERDMEAATNVGDDKERVSK